MNAVKAARWIVAALLLCFASAAFAQVAVPPLTGRVVDRTTTLSSDDIASLEGRLRDFETRKGSQIALLMVPSAKPETIEQFSLRVAEAWKIGRRKVDDGAILVVAKDDRALRIEVGYGLEGALNDATAKRIIDEIIVPKFRNRDFAGGVTAGIDRMLRVIDGEPLPKPKPEHTDNSSEIDPLWALIGVVVLGSFMRGLFGRLFGSLAAGTFAAVMGWFIAGTALVSAAAGIVVFLVTLLADSFGVPVWSSGGSGGWSGGSSGRSGGFSGGGGSFGGGGASGSW